MLQLFTQTPNVIAISTEDNRLYTHTLDAEHLIVPKSQIRFLFKITSELSGAITYVYPSGLTIYDRYSLMTIQNGTSASPDMFTGQVTLPISGHYTYEVYEVSWNVANSSIVVSETTAPANETQVLPVSVNNGVVRGLCTKGTMFIDDKAGTEQVQYTQHPEPSETNTIYYGQ